MDNLNYLKNKKLYYHFNVVITELNINEESTIINYLKTNFPKIDYSITHAINGVIINVNK